MQTDFTGKNSDPNAIVMPDFEELQFKAIGEGLGFHQQQEKPRWQQPASAKVTTTSPLSRSTPEALKPTSAPGLSREQLGAIYQPQGQVATKLEEQIPSKVKAEKLATFPERMSAQLTDLVIVTGAVFVMLMAMLFAAAVPFEQAQALLLSYDIAPIVAILWLFAYVAYFTILETRQTPGKLLMRLKVVDAAGEGLTLSRSLERTAFRTLSWLALGFPLLMDFHGRLSRTKVVRA